MRKIAFVVQRYGLEVNGGAELHCRQLAEHMRKFYDVEVITTKAVDYVTWKNEYTSDQEMINGVLVRRFSVKKPRNIKSFNKLFDKLSDTIIQQGHSSVDEEELWMRMQGPYSEDLFMFLRAHSEDYDIFIFFTYLYCTTYFGMKEVADKAILIPTAHDEVPIHFGIFNDMFRLPKGFFYNTEAEQKFVERKFHVEGTLNNSGLGGVGVELPEEVSAAAFREKYHLDDNFILYIGRVEEHKGCNELLVYYDEYKKRNKCDLKLVFMGREVMKVPKRDDVISLGFVSDEDKFNGVAACSLLVLPSQFESLSIVVLEAMSLKRPVLVHGNSEVVKGHCVKSNGGLYYQNYYEFEGCLNYMLSHPDVCKKMGENGKNYVDENYQWEAITRRLSDLIEKICEC